MKEQKTDAQIKCNIVNKARICMGLKKAKWMRSDLCWTSNWSNLLRHSGARICVVEMKIWVFRVNAHRFQTATQNMPNLKPKCTMWGGWSTVIKMKECKWNISQFSLWHTKICALAIVGSDNNKNSNDNGGWWWLCSVVVALAQLLFDAQFYHREREWHSRCLCWHANGWLFYDA